MNKHYIFRKLSKENKAISIPHYYLSLSHICFFLCLVLILFIFNPCSSADPNSVCEITITPRVNTANVGDTVWFDYSINNVEIYDNLSATLCVYTDEDMRNSQGSAHTTPEGLSGSFSFKVKYGYGVYAQISFTDSNGQHFHKNSAVITITDYNPAVPEITITPRVNTANVGDTVWFDYSINNVEIYDNLSATLCVYTDEDMRNSQGSAHTTPEGLSGSFSFKVKYGYGVYAQISFTDSNGQHFHKNSAIIEVTGYNPTNPTTDNNNTSIPDISIIPRVNAANIGDTVWFDYSITNIEDYENIQASLSVFTNEEMTSMQSGTDKWLNSLSGSTSFQIKYGYGIQARISIQDSNGQWFNKNSTTVFISNTPVFCLPSYLQKIEAGAFEGIAAKNILIPESVREIDTHAFSPGVTIYAKENSFAATWAKNNGFDVVYISGS